MLVINTMKEMIALFVELFRLQRHYPNPTHIYFHNFKPILMMFNFCETYEVDNSLVEWDYFRFSPASVNQMVFAKFQNFIDRPRYGKVVSVEDS